MRASERIDAKALGREVLEFVDVKREVAALVLRYRPPDLGRLRARSDDERADLGTEPSNMLNEVQDIKKKKKKNRHIANPKVSRTWG